MKQLKTSKVFTLSILIMLLLTIVCFMTTSYAGNTHFLVTNSFSDFKRGTFINTSVSSRGEVYLVPEHTEILNKSDLYVWTMDYDSEGNIYASTGSQGKIYKISSDKDVSVFYESPGIGLNPIELGKDDTMYLGVNPHGILYKVNSSGVSEELARFSESYIWDIKADTEGNLYVATGLTASIYKISPDGVKEKVFSATTEKHILKMLISGDTLYCVTSGNGLLYQIDPVNKVAKVLYDTYEDEIKDLVIDLEGNIIFCTSTNLKKRVPDDFNYLETFSYYSGSKQKLNTNKTYWKNSVYRINTDGTIDKLLTLDNNILISITADNQDNIYVGTGIDGTIYKIDNNDIVSVYIETLQTQIYAMFTMNNTIYASTCNMGKILEIGLEKAYEGEYISEVFNAKGEAIWGNVSWRANDDSNSIAFQVRTGNTEIPDDTWTEWSEVLSDPLGSSIGTISSRFIQYKAFFNMGSKSAVPVLYEVRLSYAMENRRPIIKSFNIKLVDNTDRSDGYFDNTKNIELSWDTDDPDNDSLLYTVLFKEKSKDVWIPLVEDIKDDKVVVSQRRFPDGFYDFKLNVRDGLSNDSASEMQNTEYSEPFIIDSTAPMLSDSKIVIDGDGFVFVDGIIEDNLSYIARLEYSINGSEWFFITPTDSIYDSQYEEFNFTFNPEDNNFEIIDGTNFIQIKMIDAYGNVSSAFIYFE